MDKEMEGTRMWLLGLWAARASDVRPRCPQPAMSSRWWRWRIGGKFL